MARLSAARRVALALVQRSRQRNARMRDLARHDASLDALQPSDRALAFRLAMGVASAAPALDALIDARLRRPSSLEPRVRDALRLACYELCYLDTPDAVAASQGVELVRSVSPHAAGLANAVLRRLAREAVPQVVAARDRAEEGAATTDDLALLSCLPTWLISRIADERGMEGARALCVAQADPAPVFVALNGLRHDSSSGLALLADAGLAPTPIEGLAGSFLLGNAAPLAASGLVEKADVAVADLSAQLVCRIAGPSCEGAMLEVGQGRATKSLLMATAVGANHPTRVEGVDSVPYKVEVASRRMEAAGLAGVVRCHVCDACRLADDDLPEALAQSFETVLVDAPCTGTGTMRRHPEIAATLAPRDVEELAKLQLRMLKAASARVAPAGTLLYATCSVLRAEDEDVVGAFLASDEGRAFHVEPVAQASACARDAALQALVSRTQTPEGYMLTMPAPGAGDGHFCARLVRGDH